MCNIYIICVTYVTHMKPGLETGIDDLQAAPSLRDTLLPVPQPNLLDSDLKLILERCMTKFQHVLNCSKVLQCFFF